MNAYFGDPWDAPAVEGAPQVDTPIGQPCQYCGVAVTANEQGFMIPTARLRKDGGIEGRVEPIHRSCLNSALGLPNLDGYTASIVFSEEDGSFVATCQEFPSLSYVAETDKAALSGLRGLLRSVILDMRRTGEAVPPPSRGTAGNQEKS